MSLLTLIQDFCERTNLPSPTAVMASQETKVKQLKALLQEEGEDLSKRGDWEGMTFEQDITTVAAEDQGVMASLCTNGFRHVKNQTIWSRARRLPVAGPIDARQWQALKALFVNGPYYRFRIRGTHLLVNPTPPAGELWAFEYVTNNWILDPDGVTYKNKFSKDGDTILLPEELMQLGLRWRWKAEKGLDYAEAMRSYEMAVKDVLGWDGAKPVLRMDEEIRQGPQPGIFVPQGSWNLT